MEIITSIPHQLWSKISEWGRDTDSLSINYQSTAMDIAHKLKLNRKFSDNDRQRAMAIYDIVCEKNIELLLEADELANVEAPQKTPTTEESQILELITIELVQKMVDWDRRKRVLKDWQWKVMDDVVPLHHLSEQSVNGTVVSASDGVLRKAAGHGFQPSPEPLPYLSACRCPPCCACTVHSHPPSWRQPAVSASMPHAHCR